MVILAEPTPDLLVAELTSAHHPMMRFYRFNSALALGVTLVAFKYSPTPTSGVDSGLIT